MNKFSETLTVSLLSCMTTLYFIKKSNLEAEAGCSQIF